MAKDIVVKEESMVVVDGRVVPMVDVVVVTVDMLEGIVEVEMVDMVEGIVEVEMVDMVEGIVEVVMVEVEMVDAAEEIKFHFQDEKCHDKIM